MLSSRSRALLLSTVFFFAGCMSSFAAPAPVAPLLGKKGDVAAAALIRPAYPTRGATAYVAAAPSDASRVYISGSMSRARGERGDDYYNERILREHNLTRQAELGAGWGRAKPRQRSEVLGGLSYGRTESAQCNRDWLDSYSFCMYWVDGEARFARAFVQGQTAFYAGRWSGGFGTRLSLSHYQYEELFGSKSHLSARIVSLEPFILHRVHLPFGALQLMIHVPIVPYSPEVAVEHVDPSTKAVATHATRLVESPVPRIYLGFQANLDELWRDR